MALTKNDVVIDANAVGSYTTTVTSTSDVLLFDTPNMNAAFLQVTGSAADFTYILEGTLDGSTWVSLYYIRKSDNAISPAITQNNVYYANVASFVQVRLTVSAIASGSSTIVFASNAAGSFIIGQQSGASAGSNSVAVGTLTQAAQTVVIDTQGMSTVIADVAGTYAGIVVLEALNPIGTWIQLGTSFVVGQIPYTPTSSLNSITGRFVANCSGYSQMRVRMASYTSGTATVYINATVGSQAIMSLQAGSWAMSQKDGTTQTFRAAAVGIVPGATPTDIFTMIGSATKTIRITKLVISGTQTTGAVRDVILLRRSTGNTAGTRVVMTAVKNDINNVAATADVGYYTANPSALGTLVGRLETQKVFIGAATVAVNPVIWEFGWRPPAQAIVLRGTTDIIAINMNAITSGGNNYTITVEWTEE